MAEGELVQADLVKVLDVGKHLLTVVSSTTASKESLIEDLKVPLLLSKMWFIYWVVSEIWKCLL
mgnify:CR=1 FL=1